MKLTRICLPVAMLFVSIAQADGPNYEDHIKPLFRAHCLKCHNADNAEADLDLSSFAAVIKGGSSGEVVQAGRPESSQLYRAVIHADGVEAMPPESPKLAEEKLALVREWIRGGLIGGKGSKSQLRNVAAMLAPVSPGAPAPLPESLPDVEPTQTVRPPIPQAMAASPGASLFAVSGQEQILLYVGTNQSSVDVHPTAEDAIERRWAFDGEAGEVSGKIGDAAEFGAEVAPVRIDPVIDFSSLSELTVSMWIRPRDGENAPTVFGTEHSFKLFLERHKHGWRPRIFLRDQDNSISYFGRVGVLPLDEWSHLVAVWNGSTWNWFIDGQHVVEQKCPETLKRIQQRPNSPQSIGGIVNASGDKEHGFNGDLDELRIYRKALSRDEVGRLMQEASQSKSFAFAGALSFPEGTIHDIKFSHNGSLLMAAGGRGAHSGRVVLFDVRSGQRVAEIGDEVDSVLAAGVSTNHQYVAFGGPSKIVKVFSTKTGELLHRIKKHTDWVTAVSFSPDGKMFATGDRSGGLHIWETEKGAIVYTLDEHKVRITDLSWRADGAVLASGAEDGNLILWSMKDGFPLRNIAAHTSKESPRYSRRTGVLALDFANDGRLLTTGRDGMVRLWSVDGEQQLELSIEDGLPVSASFIDGSVAAVVGLFDGSLHVFDLAVKSRTQLLSTADVTSGGGER